MEVKREVITEFYVAVPSLPFYEKDSSGQLVPTKETAKRGDAFSLNKMIFVKYLFEDINSSRPTKMDDNAQTVMKLLYNSLKMSDQDILLKMSDQDILQGIKGFKKHTSTHRDDGQNTCLDQKGRRPRPRPRPRLNVTQKKRVEDEDEDWFLSRFASRFCEIFIFLRGRKLLSWVSDTESTYECLETRNQYTLVWGSTDLMVRHKNSKQQYHFTPVVDMSDLQETECKLVFKPEKDDVCTGKRMFTRTFSVQVVISNLTFLYMIQLCLKLFDEFDPKLVPQFMKDLLTDPYMQLAVDQVHSDMQCDKIVGTDIFKTSVKGPFHFYEVFVQDRSGLDRIQLMERLGCIQLYKETPDGELRTVPATTPLIYSTDLKCVMMDNKTIHHGITNNLRIYVLIRNNMHPLQKTILKILLGFHISEQGVMRSSVDDD